MSDTATPRTDAFMKYCFGDDREFIPADFARQLERELAEAQRNIDFMDNLLCETCGCVRWPKENNK